VRTPDRRRNRPAAAFILTLLSSAPPAACLTAARDGDRRPATAATPQAPPIGGPGALAGRMPPANARASRVGTRDHPAAGLGQARPALRPWRAATRPRRSSWGACWGFTGTNPGRRSGHPGRIVSLPHPSRRAPSATLPAGRHPDGVRYRSPRAPSGGAGPVAGVSLGARLAGRARSGAQGGQAATSGLGIIPGWRQAPAARTVARVRDRVNTDLLDFLRA
jgi:hypothetical protein